ncbi:MAG: UTP--glucose-1-phosphate uridylyltransferase [Oscillospiraceae bacterium]|jgi:UTP--glucose-1-phosphate uridylyltransferase|nr:UTP--glucose-1-phosphate uridylyltransferase [Oscillospiraceae bacterium]
MKIKKAVIPAAGLGTRVLPASKSMPKEMLPIVDKPAIQYIVEEAVASGISDILIITSRGKTTVEDHFDRSPELEKRLLDSGKTDIYKQMLAISEMANIHFLRQQEAGGLGHAVLCAKSFVGGEAFAVLYGDDVIIGDNPVCKQLCDVYDEFGKGVVGMKEVSWEQIKKYSSLKTAPVREGGNVYSVTDMVEKPPTREKAFSRFSILGRCVLPASVFPVLETIPKGVGGELQLTDAMAVLSRSEGMYGVDFIGRRYDMGSKLGILQACVELGLAHEEIGEDFRKYLQGIASSL